MANSWETLRWSAQEYRFFARIFFAFLEDVAGRSGGSGEEAVGVIRFGGQVVYAAADHRRTDISYSIGLV
jgi:acetyl-CoA carboxylase carboxyltransferase component